MVHNEFQRIYDYIKNQSGNNEKMYIPEVWNKYIGYSNYEKCGNNEICVKTYEFYQVVLDKILELETPESYDLKKSQIYCAMPRYSTAWDIAHDGNMNNGTFLRLMILLPMLHYL